MCLPRGHGGDTRCLLVLTTSPFILRFGGQENPFVACFEAGGSPGGVGGRGEGAAGPVSVLASRRGGRARPRREPGLGCRSSVPRITVSEYAGQGGREHGSAHVCPRRPTNVPHKQNAIISKVPI